MNGRRLDLITLQEAMDTMEVSRSTLDRWRKTKKLPYIKIGKEIYFHKADLESWVRSQTRVLAPPSVCTESYEPETITVGYQSGTAYMWSPLIIQELGLFEEELALIEPSRPVTVRWQDAVSGLELVEGMIKGQLQIASLGDYPITISRRLSGLLPGFNPVLLAFDGKSFRGKGISIVVPNGTSLREPSELAGRDISTVMNSSAARRVSSLLSALGERNAKMVHNDMNGIWTNMNRMAAGVSAMWEPYLSLVKYQETGTVIFEEGLGEDYLTGVVAEEEWSQRHEGAVVAYLKAHLRAHRMIREEPLKAAKIISSRTGFPRPVVASILMQVRWDASVYGRDLETLQRMEEAEPSAIAYRGHYLENAARRLMLPRLTADPIAGDWALQPLY